MPPAVPRLDHDAPDSGPPAQTVSDTTRDLESSLLRGVREWTDLFGWLRLGRTLRAAASPPLLLLTGVTYSITSIGHTPMIHWADGIYGSKTLSLLLEHYLRLSPAVEFFVDSPRGAGYRIASYAGWMLLWTPVAMLVARQGALLTADRPMMEFSGGLRHAWTRSPQAWIAALVPIACAASLSLLTLLLGGIGHLIEGFDAIEIAIGWLAGIFAIPVGLLLFGALFAVPLAWSAIVNEAAPDPLDSLSRGYEYLYRRPLQLFFYLLISIALIALVGSIACGIATTASLASRDALDIVNAPDGLIAAADSIFRHIPIVAMLTVSWALIGGVYLLIRRDAGGQEIEDLWQPVMPPPPPLPELKR